MDEEKIENLCISLVKAETEDVVRSLLEENNLWDVKHWQLYGEHENNFATIGNQQSKPECALVEKIINSVDAVLMAACLSKGIDPESPEDAPDSINKALEEYFDIYEGKLSTIDANARAKLAEENINFIATGARSNPCYILTDSGEGQIPSKFKDTFLSIGKENKFKISFVQGKFNMGGTGVLQFCGKQNFQLILSKRNPSVLKNENKTEDSNLWGFTLVRRDNPSEVIRSSVYRYLAPQGKILTFKANSLPVLPGKYPEPYASNFEYGTLIKLYEYQAKGLKTNILFDLYKGSSKNR